MQRIARRITTEYYPDQFWWLLVGALVTRIAASMVWPFLTIFITQKLNTTLTIATLLFTVQSIASILGAVISSSLMDRFGRKQPMIAGIVINAFVLAAMPLSGQMGVWVILVTINGLVMPIYMTGINAMAADLLEPEQRTAAYAIVRIVSNFGVAVGPIIGGIIAGVLAIEHVYYANAIIYIIISLWMIPFLAETMPHQEQTTADASSGYGFIFKDRTYLSFALAFIFVQVAYSQMFMLLPVYSADNFGLQPAEYSLIFTLNAGMVVLFQFPVTRLTMPFPVLPTIAVGTLFYAVGIGSVALGHNLAAFMTSMGIMTVGELILTPPATAFIANLAPVHMRARYMSLFGLAFPLAMGIGPAVGGFMNDTFAPVAIWYCAGLTALVSALVFFLMAARYQRS